MNLACQGPDIASHVDYGADAGSHWQSNHLKDGLGTYSNCRTEQEAELLCRMLKKSHFSGSITEVKIMKSDIQPPKSCIFSRGSSASKDSGSLPLPNNQPLR